MEEREKKRLNENEEYDNQQFDDDDGKKYSSQATSGCTEDAVRTRKCKKI